MYRLQVFKGGLTSSVMGSGGGGGGEAEGAWESAASASASRFISKEDLKNLLVLGNTGASETAAMVSAVLAPPPTPSAELAAHVMALGAPPISSSTVGLSHHDHLFSLRPEEAAAIARHSLGAPGTAKKTPRRRAPRRADPASAAASAAAPALHAPLPPLPTPHQPAPTPHVHATAGKAGRLRRLGGGGRQRIRQQRVLWRGG